MKKTVFKIALVLISFIPLIFRFPDLYRAWGHSVNGLSVNAADPFFMLLGGVTVMFLIFYRRTEAGAMDYAAIPGAVLSVAALVIGILWCENAFYFAGAILLPAFLIWFLFGWRFCYRIFPVPLLFLLGLPTMMYLRFFPAMTLNWKIAIASALCIYTFFALLTDFNPIRRQSAVFAFAVIAYALLYAAVPSTVLHRGEPLIPKGIAESIEPADTLPKGIEVSLIGDNVISSRQENFSVSGRNVAVLVLNCRTRDGRDYVIYHWFSCENFSTGDYALFRRSRSDGKWFSCTLISKTPGKSFAELLREKTAQADKNGSR